MIGEERICAREGCDVKFTKKTHNQKYHDDGCCKLATNSRMMVNYYKKKAIKQGAPRYCNECKDVKLSRYNHSNTCGACQNKEQEQTRSNMILMFSTIQAV